MEFGTPGGPRTHVCVHKPGPIVFSEIRPITNILRSAGGTPFAEEFCGCGKWLILSVEWGYFREKQRRNHRAVSGRWADRRAVSRARKWRPAVYSVSGLNVTVIGTGFGNSGGETERIRRPRSANSAKGYWLGCSLLGTAGGPDLYR